MMQIHHIIDDIPVRVGGAEKLVQLFHRELLSRGYDSLLVSLADSPIDKLDSCSSLGLNSPYSLKAIGKLFCLI